MDLKNTKLIEFDHFLELERDASRRDSQGSELDFRFNVDLQGKMLMFYKTIC